MFLVFKIFSGLYLAPTCNCMLNCTFQAHGVEDLLRPGVMVCCSNVQTAGRRDGLPALKATEMTHITTNPRQHHLQRAVKALHAEITVNCHKNIHKP